ncbi:tetratricopeptide repeat protein [Hydrogenophaga sp.]|uniref:tetratricopeptide repeat protein n=1 Tax=Hydrogenophaga sp. TaxID=1904254 RepID=UPI002632B00E|nr:tetratricopeptide repeat protein [Hydrogenophaga sp.]MCW5652927.1 tetratricopeptide repeat protein [Hydrogenophaga sp.]
MTDTDTLERARGHFFDGNTHFEAGRLAEARHSYQQALALVPGRPSVLANLGVTECRMGLWDEAVAHLAPATVADPAHRDAWVALGLSHEALGHWQAAVDALREGLHLGAGTPQLWLSLALCQLHLEQPAPALASLDQALALDPTLGEAWSQRGGLLRDAGRFDEAARCFEQALTHGADADLNRFYLASVRASGAGGIDEGVPPQPPRAYVESLFNEYAGDFQTHLVEQLNYQAHRTLLAPLRESGRHFPLVLDLGCGTGLCGQIIRDRADAVDGVDLAEAMVARARQGGAYRRVVHGDLLGFLREQAEPVDLVIAADVFIYVGALDEVFAAVRSCLRPGGALAFSVELASGEPGLQLRPSLRYAHTPAYVAHLAQAHGFQVRQQWQAPLREDQRQPVMGLYVWLEPALAA